MSDTTCLGTMLQQGMSNTTMFRHHVFPATCRFIWFPFVACLPATSRFILFPFVACFVATCRFMIVQCLLASDLSLHLAFSRCSLDSDLSLHFVSFCCLLASDLSLHCSMLACQRLVAPMASAIFCDRFYCCRFVSIPCLFCASFGTMDRQLRARLGAAKLVLKDHLGQPTHEAVSSLQRAAVCELLAKAKLSATERADLAQVALGCDWHGHDGRSVLAAFQPREAAAMHPTKRRRAQQSYEALLQYGTEDCNSRKISSRISLST